MLGNREIPLSEKTCSIQLAFFLKDDYADAVDSFSQSCAASWTETNGHRFTHVELRFLNRRNTNTNQPFSCSILDSKTVHLDTKKFCRPGYGFLRIPVSPEQEDAMWKYCLSMKRNKVSFNWIGQWINFVCPFSYHTNGKSVFCSELVTMILQVGGVLDSTIRPYKVHPNLLYDLVEKNVEGVVNDTGLK